MTRNEVTAQSGLTGETLTKTTAALQEFDPREENGAQLSVIKQ